MIKVWLTWSEAWRVESYAESSSLSFFFCGLEIQYQPFLGLNNWLSTYFWMDKLGEGGARRAYNQYPYLFFTYFGSRQSAAKKILQPFYLPMFRLFRFQNGKVGWVEVSPGAFLCLSSELEKLSFHGTWFSLMGFMRRPWNMWKARMFENLDPFLWTFFDVLELIQRAINVSKRPVLLVPL